METIKKTEYKPNFLIVGAAKAGTTSLAKYLDEHPNIYMSKVKEPRFLISNAINGISKKDPSYSYLRSNSVLNLKDYVALFKDRQEKIFGEASVHYLYHKEEATENIKKYLGLDVKIVIVLRNPVHRAISNWKYQDKDFLDLKEALNNQELRKSQGYNSFWYYKDLGFYHNQVKYYMDNFDNVKIILFEDFVSNTNNVLRDLYGFLEVDDTFQNNNFERYNANTSTIIPKGKVLHYLVNSQARVNVFKYLVNKKIIPKNLFLDKNTLVTNEDVSYLKDLYKEDIKKLQKLIKQDLTNWL